MKEKIKRLLLIILVAILFTLSAALLLLNVGSIITYFQIDPETSQQEKEQKEKLEVDVWKYSTELKYLDRYCEISELFPNEESPRISLQVERYETSAGIETPFNPFPGYSVIYEIGAVTASNSDEIDTDDSKMKLYRIELLKDSDTYVEYVSNRDIPYFYIVKDTNSAEFLLYPTLIQYKDMISNEYYIEIL